MSHNAILSADGKEIYYFGIIDILQEYNTTKRMERFYKTKILRYDVNGVSVQPPNYFRERFVENICSHFEIL
jgi:1-phosphatidylinositol-4-phosphate 5-kinase